MKRWFWAFDVATVISFVVIGRDNHGFTTDWLAAAEVAFPFLVGLGVGTFLTKAWTHPTSMLVGFGNAAATIAIGLLLRRVVFDGGTATTFVWLTAGWMTLWMVGWRVVANIVDRLMHDRRASTVA